MITRDDNDAAGNCHCPILPLLHRITLYKSYFTDIAKVNIHPLLYVAKENNLNN